MHEISFWGVLNALWKILSQCCEIFVSVVIKESAAPSQPIQQSELEGDVLAINTLTEITS